MDFFLIGVNHASAPVRVREKIVFSHEQLAHALQSACQACDLKELVILSTCNRTELYSIHENATAVLQPLLEWLCKTHGLPLAEIQPYSYCYQGEIAVRHLMRVASGLDSLVLGEPQILGQVKAAYQVAKEVGTVDILLHRLFQQTFAVAKQVRTDTDIGANPISVAYTAVMLAKSIFSDLTSAQVLLIGAGDTIELVARHLYEQGVRQIVVANRTLERARGLAEPLHAEVILLSEVSERLKHTDILISSTASPVPILGKGAVESALKARRHRPIYMVDLAVPRDIEPEVSSLNDVYLYTIDDLQHVIADNVQSRERAVMEAEKIIEARVSQFLEQLRTLQIVDVLKAYRDKMESYRQQEVDKAVRQLSRGDNPHELILQLSRILLNKFLHVPSVQIKRAHLEGHDELIKLANKLFELDQSE